MTDVDLQDSTSMREPLDLCNQPRLIDWNVVGMIGGNARDTSVKLVRFVYHRLPVARTLSHAYNERSLLLHCFVYNLLIVCVCVFVCSCLQRLCVCVYSIVVVTFCAAHVRLCVCVIFRPVFQIAAAHVQSVHCFCPMLARGLDIEFALILSSARSCFVHCFAFKFSTVRVCARSRVYFSPPRLFYNFVQRLPVAWTVSSALDMK